MLGFEPRLESSIRSSPASFTLSLFRLLASHFVWNEDIVSSILTGETNKIVVYFSNSYVIMNLQAENIPLENAL